MKKIITLFALLCLSTGLWAQSGDYSGIEISFNKSAATEANFMNVTVVVKDLDGNAISGVTAEPVSVDASDLVNSGMGSSTAAALSWTEKVLIGGRYSNNNYNSNTTNPGTLPQVFVLKISGLRTGFAFNKAEVDLYGCSRTGTNVSSNSIAISCAIQTGNAADNMSDFVSSTGNNINGSQDGGLWHKVTTMRSATEKTVAANGDLYVKVTIQKTNDSGTQCRPCFRTVRLSKIPLYEVTYKVVDANSEELASFMRKEEEGTTITTLPADYQRTLFYTYDAIDETTVDAAKTVTFTATLKSESELPFIPSTSFANAVWHNLTLHNTPNYVTYTASGSQNVTLPTTFADNATTQWAFVGTPYSGFKIVNRAAGSALVLGSATTSGAANTGQSIYATLQTEGQQTNEVWNPEATTATESYYTGKVGFFLRNTEGHALNKRNGTSNISYWTTGADNGSTFVATRVSLSELVTKANTLYTTLNTGHQNVQIGYPTASALSTFSGAIAAAQDVLDNSGDEMAGWDALQAAITTVKSPANTVYTPRTDVYYTITSARGSMIYEPTYAERDTDNNTDEFVYHTGNTSGTKNGKTHINVSLDPTNPNHQWGFIYYDNKYYMYNVGKKQFAGIGKGSYGATWTFSNTPSSVTLDAGINNSVVPSDVRVRATSAVTGQTYSMSISPSYHGPVITYDAQGDGGIPMTFAVATATQDAAVTAAIEALLEDLTPYRDALQDAIHDANALNDCVGSGLNQYTITEGQSDFDNALAAAETEVAKVDDETSKADLITARENLETAQAGLTKSLNMPAANTFLRIKGVVNGYVSSITGQEKQPSLAGGDYATSFTTGGSADAANTIWLYDGTHLISYATGLYSQGCMADVAGVAEPKTYTFVEATDVYGKYWIKPSNTNYWFGGTPTLDYWGTPAGKNETRFELEEVTTLPVTISSAGYATLYAPVALTIPSGVKAYKGTINTGYVHLDEIEGTIPANCAVVLEGSAGTYDFEITTGGSVESNDFLGEVATFVIPSTDTYYSLRANSDGTEPGFYIKDEGKTIQGFRAYLQVSGGANIRAFLFNETTGISTINPSHVVLENAYDLQGRRVQTPARGLYIINGKKVIF